MSSIDVRNFVKLGKKIIGAGLNYKSIIKEKGVPTPKTPFVFLKPTTSYITHGQQIKCPEEFNVHHEVELGVIIGKKGKDICPSEVGNYIGGYCLALDLTAVDQLVIARSSGLPWTLGKGFDTACPVSEAIPKDRLPNPCNARLWLAVNSTIRQDSTTADMLFPTNELISYVSKYMTLEPYDLILTGSPAGVGPLCSGDVVTAGLEDILNIEFCVT